LTDQEKQSLTEESESGNTLKPSAAGAAAKVVRYYVRTAIVTPQILFLVIGLVFGLVLVFVNPMFHAPDEIYHFEKSYAVSEGTLVPAKKGGLTGYRLPVSIQKTFDTLRVAPGVRPTGPEVHRAFRIPLKKGVSAFYESPSASHYTPVPYIPQAVGVGIGRVLDASPLTLAYMGRAFNLLAWLILVFIAISFTPVLKWVFFLLAVMPMSMHQAASLSPDCVTTAVAFLFAAFVFKLAWDKRKPLVTHNDIALLFALAILLALVKPPYFLLVFLVFLIPSRKFRNVKQYRLVVGIMLLIVLLVGISLTALAAATYHSPVREMSQGGQASYITKHPLKYANIVLRNLNRGKEDLLYSFAGVFGLAESALPAWLPFVYLFVLFCAAALDKDYKIKVGLAPKLLGAGVFLVTSFGIVTALYLARTPVGDASVLALQGRYLIPLAPLVFLLFYNRVVGYEKNRVFYAIMVVIPVLAAVMTILKIA